MKRQKTKLLPSSPAAIVQVQQAADLVEQAQQLLGKACQKLSPLRNGVDLYKKTSKLYDQAHSLWYDVDTARRRTGMSVDSECERCHTNLSGWKYGDPPHRCPNPCPTCSDEGMGDGCRDCGRINEVLRPEAP